VTPIRTPHELFVHRLQTMLWVEETLAKEILPMLRDHVHSTGLTYGLERHELETKQHALTVRGILHLIGERGEPQESRALLGLKAEHDELMEEIDLDRHAVSDLMHAGVIAQSEHLEISAYTELRSLANALGEEDVAMRLQEILEQEQHALELVEKQLAKLLAEEVENA
jgi:ferritin-like metal-binding protein YciE